MNERYKPTKHKNPVKAIREFCIECMGGKGNGQNISHLIKECSAPDCALYDYRLGKNPYHSQNLTEEQKKERAERLKKPVHVQNGWGKVAQI